MVISLTNGKKVISLLSEASVQRAIEKIKVWAKSYVPPSKPVDLNKARRAEAIAKNPDKVPFCHQYWADAQAEGILRPRRHRVVDSHGELHAFNHLFVTGQGSRNFQDTMSLVDKRIIRDVVRETDWQFKCLEPTKESVTVYRVVGEKPPFFEQEVKLYNKAFNVKKGDIITMPEYAYFAGGRQYSDVYMGYEGRGIIYEMEIPAGARVSRSGEIVNGKLDDWGAELVIPRSSQMEVIETKMLENGSKYIKLRYILPKEPWRA